MGKYVDGKILRFIIIIRGNEKGICMLIDVAISGGRNMINPFTPNDHYSGRTAPLTSKRFILCIYSTNIDAEYFKHGIYSPIFLFKMQFVS